MSAYAPAVARIVNRGVGYHDEVRCRQHGDEVHLGASVSRARVQRLRDAGYEVTTKSDGPCWPPHVVRRPAEGDGIGDPGSG